MVKYTKVLTQIEYWRKTKWRNGFWALFWVSWCSSACCLPRRWRWVKVIQGIPVTKPAVTKKPILTGTRHGRRGTVRQALLRAETIIWTGIALQHTDRLSDPQPAVPSLWLYVSTETPWMWEANIFVSEMPRSLSVTALLRRAVGLPVQVIIYCTSTVLPATW